MPIAVHGWVEVSNWDPQWRNHPKAWQGLLSLGPFQLGACNTSAKLFGFKAESYGKPLIPARGLPTNPSNSLTVDAAQIEAHEQRYGAGEFFGFTHADLEEIRTLAPELFDPAIKVQCDWRLVFRTVEALRCEPEFTGSGFRLVCWAEW